MHRPVLCWVLLGLLALSAYAGGGRAGGPSDPTKRDLVVDKRGNEVRGRVVRRYGGEGVEVLNGGSSQIIKHEEVARIETTRDRLTTFLAERKAGLSLEEDWKLVARAGQLQLPHLQRLQALHVLLRDPDHTQAHEFLGHKRRNKRWRWVLGKHEADKEELDKLVTKWSDRVSLRSEHFVVETNTSLRNAVNMAFDLERLYVAWLGDFGALFELSEDVRDPLRVMTVLVYPSKYSEDFKDSLSASREPFYSAATNLVTSSGNPNLAITYYREGDEFPVDFFDIATQQLLYSTTVLGGVKGELPDFDGTRMCHWVELGMGYWFGRQFGGQAGYAARQPFVTDYALRRLAATPATSGPLTDARNELTNLIGLHMELYHLPNDLAALHRAKARTFVEYLMTARPQVEYRRGRSVDGFAGLVGYLREAYHTPRSHSSSAFDNALGGKVEVLEAPWLRWLENK
jgi:hypothetical protein